MASLTDSLLEDFLSMRKVCLDMVEENCRLRGKVEGLTEALAAQGQRHTVGYSKALQKVPTVEYFQTAKTTEEQPTGTLILTAANLKPAVLENLIKRNVDPCQLGLRNVKLRQNKEGVIVSSTSAEGLKRLEEHITKDKNLRDVAARKPRVQLPEFNIVGIEDNIEYEEIVERIVGQNNINAGKEDIERMNTWKKKSGKTAVIKTGKKAYEQMKKRKQIYVGWTCCPVFDNTFVPRFVKCARMGHTEIYCPVDKAEFRWVRCARSHYYKHCNAAEECCASCLELPDVTEEDAYHTIMSFQCPVYLLKKKEILQRILVQMDLP
ncbi:hypothetical protein HPB48_023029 [Haemaphysalis longicornis]|uniref:Uncharacterized protein n=1 Tax=Haemaphysalis longicornis TaxID=44386 RepID=A0A9J6G9E6_HAELO|nr:hypothetical protein HPB48_023029 [Haemaphysalis longicornis]